MINEKYNEEHFNRIKDTLIDTQLYHSREHLYVGKYRVYSEYLKFIGVPFSRFVSIRFKLDRYKYDKIKQEQLISDFMRFINKTLKERYPDKIRYNRPVRCILKREVGKSLEGDMHVHLLLLIDERVRDLVENDIDGVISYLTDEFPDELEKPFTQPINNKEKQLSYFCKIDNKIDNHFVYLLGIRKIIKKFYPCVPQKILPLPSVETDTIDSTELIKAA
jgi:hypothetical protein